MKNCLILALVVLAVPAEAGLRHLSLGGGGKGNTGGRRRGLADGADVDQDNLYQARGVQYVDLKVGCPAQTQSAIISTASSAIGFPCSGCTNDCGEGSHLNGLYHQFQSTCFSEVACGECLMSSYSCDKYQCPVSMSYLEGSSWSGIEVEDMVSVGGEDAGEAAFPLRFGCQSDITGLFEDQIPDGIFGMSKETGSAISQWSELGYLDESAFSLCYNVREDVKKKSGVMVLGGSDTRLHEKPMVFAKDVGEKNYEVRIKEITLQRGPKLPMRNPESATTSVGLGLDGTDTAVLDSGTTCSYLNRAWKDSLQDAWNQMTGNKYRLFSHLSITEAELDELPTIVFELEGVSQNETISVSYPPMRYMEKKEYGDGYDFCMYADESASRVTLGNSFMSGHDVLHDLDNDRIGFAESHCEISVIQPPGISVSSGAEDEGFFGFYHSTSTPPPAAGGGNVTTTNTTTPPKKYKAVLLQPEPIHKREKNPAEPILDTLYVGLAIAAVAIFVVWYRRRHKLAYWAEPNTKHAYRLSFISLVLTLLAIIAGVALYLTTGSSLFLVLGLENCVDFLSSLVVLWRFFAPSYVCDKLEAKLHAREQRASVAISFILVALAVSVWVTAFQDVARGQEDQDPSEQKVALAISFVSSLLFGILTFVKFHYAKALDSPSLYKDGICSLIGTTLSLSLFINTLIIKAAPAAWWIDPAVAIVCGLFSLVYGMWALYTARCHDQLPIFSLQWWFLSPDDDEEDVGNEGPKPTTEGQFT